MKSGLKIIVTGLIAQYPELGGMTWHYLNYLLGLVALGHDVYYFEDSGHWPYNLDGGPNNDQWIASNCNRNLDYLKSVLDRFGLGARWAYRFPITAEWYGISDALRKDVVQSADLLINVSGSLIVPAEYRSVRKLIYVDTDPVFTQIKLARGAAGDWSVQALDSVLRRLPLRFQGVEADAPLPKLLAKAGMSPARCAEKLEQLGNFAFRRRIEAHDAHFSFGVRVDSIQPKTVYQWRPTRQPVALSEWRTTAPYRDVFTTVMNWTSYKPVSYGGRTYGQKDAEFRRFLELPSKTSGATLEIALSKKQHVTWQSESDVISPELREALARNPQWTSQDLLSYAGWHVVDAMQVCRDLDGYRAYIQSSKAEWSVAKNGYVVGQAGWFSDRSACYLASGRPVVVQDTGFGPGLPTGRGILSFSDMEESAEAIREVQSNYKCHVASALEIAREYFDSAKVLRALIVEAGA